MDGEYPTDVNEDGFQEVSKKKSKKFVEAPTKQFGKNKNLSSPKRGGAKKTHEGISLPSEKKHGPIEEVVKGLDSKPRGSDDVETIEGKLHQCSVQPIDIIEKDDGALKTSPETGETPPVRTTCTVEDFCKSCRAYGKDQGNIYICVKPIIVRLLMNSFLFTLHSITIHMYSYILFICVIKLYVLYRGLSNSGNSCYRNAILQSMLSLNPFTT